MHLYLKDAWTEEDQGLASACHSACYTGRQRSATEVNLPYNSGDPHLVQAGQNQVLHSMSYPGVLLIRPDQKQVILSRQELC